MCDAVEKASGLRPHIKWINDLILNRRKLGGILTELSVGSNGLVDYAIVGIGINCCQQKEDFPTDLQDIATSLAIAGASVSPEVMAGAMVQALCNMDITEKTNTLCRYKADCLTLDQDVVILRGDEQKYGKAVDLDSDGCLIVEFPDGHREIVSSGEASVRGMY
jgi:BirA family biotin operon repressor/biotin-[acetyl-CoA-carboxylase] ligase